MFIKHHKLKIEPRWFNLAQSGIKPFEIRKNDRDYIGGDLVTLKEFDPETQEYTGSEIHGIISLVCDYEQKEGIVIFSYVRVSSETMKKLLQVLSHPAVQFSDYKAPVENDFYKRQMLGDMVKTNE